MGAPPLGKRRSWNYPDIPPPIGAYLNPRTASERSNPCNGAGIRAANVALWFLGQMPQSTNGSKCSKPPHSIPCWTGADACRSRSRPPARSEWFAIRTTDRMPVGSMKPTPPRSRMTVEASPLITSRNSASKVSAVERLSSPMAETMSASPACSTWTVSGPSLRVLSQLPIARSNPDIPLPIRCLFETALQSRGVMCAGCSS